MRPMTLAYSAIVLALVLAAASCGSEDPAASNDPSASAAVSQAQGTQSDGPINLLLIPDGNSQFPPATVVQCGGPPTFLAGALNSPELVADSPVADGALDVFDSFINNEEGAWWPADGYWVLTNTDTELLLAHIGTDREVTLIGTELVDGVWQATAIQSGGPCAIQVPLPAGVHEVDWRLDPSVPVDEASTTVSLLATGRACSSGQPMLDRLREPQVMLTDTNVYLVLIADRPSGAQTCPGNPEESVLVSLDTPLGSRQVVNARLTGGTLPDFLPVSPCGQLAAPRSNVGLSSPPERTQCT